MSITLLKQCDGIVMKWTCPDDVDTSGNRKPWFPRKFLSKNHQWGPSQGLSKSEAVVELHVFSWYRSNVSTQFWYFQTLHTRAIQHEPYSLFPPFGKSSNFCNLQFSSPLAKMQATLRKSTLSSSLPRMSQSVQTTLSGECILLAAWMRSEALQCFHSLLISEPISKIDSKLGLLPSSRSWFMKQRFFTNSSVLELLTTRTLVMLSLPRIASCSGDAIISPLEI